MDIEDSGAATVAEKMRERLPWHCKMREFSKEANSVEE
jgi:hypothetical protein